MTQSALIEPEIIKKSKPKRRDLVLLPAVSLITICLMSVSSELLSRWLYPVTQIGFQDCFVTNDPAGDAAVKANSVCWEQTAESSLLAEYRFNSRGHRAGAELSSKPPGTYRIVLIGSSITQGLFVPREETFAALLPEQLSIDTGRKVEVYNEATGGKFRGGPYPTRSSAQHFDQVLAAQPDLILWVMSPTDILNAESKGSADSPNAAATQEEPRSAAAKPRTFWNGIVASIVKGTFGERLRSRWEDTRTYVVLKHLMIASESQDAYIKSYLRNADDANFLKALPDPKWQMQVQYFNTEFEEIAGLAKNAGVPLVAVFVPNRAQAAMLSSGDWPAGYDPLKLAGELRDRVANHGGGFIDILGDYRRVSHAEQYYFPVNGHPNADGHARIAEMLAKELTSGAVTALKAAHGGRSLQKKR